MNVNDFVFVWMPSSIHATRVRGSFRLRRSQRETIAAEAPAPPHAAVAAATFMEATRAAVPPPLMQQMQSELHSEASLRDQLRALAKPMAATKRSRLLTALCSGLRIWQADEWDPDWRRAASQPEVARAIAQAASLAAVDFKPGAHIPREAAEQLSSLEWPRRRDDFLAFAMPGFCHAAAAVAFSIATAARPQEAWVILISQLHASVLSLTSATLVDFNAAAMQHVAKIDATAYLQQLILPSEQWAAYPDLELYLANLRPAIMHQRRMPAWAPADFDRFERLRRTGKLADDFAQGDAMLVEAAARET